MTKKHAAPDIDIYAECPDGIDPVQWRRSNYTCGLSNTSLAGMILVTLLFVPLVVVLLCRLPGPASSPAPAPAETHTEPWLPTLQQTVSVVWTVSLLACSYLGFWIYTFSRTMGAAAVFFRVSYGVTLAYAAAGLAGPASGVAAAHLATAWAAGLLGYALAEYRMRDGGGERAADEAAARTPAVLSEGQELSRFYAVFMSSMMTLFLAAIAAWAVFAPGDGEQGTVLRLLGISALVWWILFFWATIVNLSFLHEALVSGDFLSRFLYYFMGSIFLGFLCSLVSLWLWVYCFGLEMMAMAAFFGYTLAVNARCKEILARDQPLLKDLELGDAVLESARASTGENA
ncbi:unnamed protein product [Urochloa decumbens]|uniref:Transmembrane protein n=1 Tax=Urochloa decumbens TaxID=240449 RepID=A0ABC9AQK2_9POAL